MAKLVPTIEGSTQGELQLNPGTFRIGRSEHNDIQLQDSSVSGSHCELVVQDRTVLVRDLGSTNGTAIDGAPTMEGRLSHGQTLTLGTMSFRYVADGEPPVSGAKPVVRVVTPATARPAAAVVLAVSPVTATMTVPDMDDPEPHTCHSHPRTQARFGCPQCRDCFCELCVNTRTVGGTAHKYCRKCGVECRPLRVELPKAAKPKGFFGLLPTAFSYPFRGAGIFTMAGLAIVIGIANVLGGGTRFGFLPRNIGVFSLLIGVFCYGYLFAYMQSIVQCTAAGDNELPQMPGLTSVWEDIVVPFLQAVGLVLIWYAPTVLVLVLGGSTFMKGFATGDFSEAGMWVVLFLAVYVLGQLCVPMAFLTVAILDTVVAANPITVIGSILKVPLEYLAVLVLVGGLLLVGFVGDASMEALFPRGLTTRSTEKLIGYLALKIAWGLLGVYLAVVVVRVLGLLYLTRKSRLGWLPR